MHSPMSTKEKEIEFENNIGMVMEAHKAMKYDLLAWAAGDGRREIWPKSTDTAIRYVIFIPTLDLLPTFTVMKRM